MRVLARTIPLALVVAGIPFLLNDLHPALPFPDFSAYYLAGAALNEGKSPYDPASQRLIAARNDLAAEVSYSRFVYPPGVAAVMRPIAALPYRWAALLWFACSVSVMIVALRRLMTLYRWPRRALTRYAFGALLVLAPASIETLVFGQINTVVLLLVVAALDISTREAESPAAGVYLALATALKLFPAGFLLALRRQRIGTALGGFALACIVSAAVGEAWGGGRTAFLEWWRSIRPVVQALGASPPNQSIHGVLRRLAEGGTFPYRVIPTFSVGSMRLDPILAPDVAVMIAVAVTVFVLIASVIAVLLVPARGSMRVDIGLRLSVLIAAALIVSPVAWDHYDVLLLINVFVLFRAASRSPAIWWIGLAGVTLVVLHRYWRVLIAAAGYGALSLALTGIVLCWVAAVSLLVRRATHQRSTPHLATNA